MQKNTNRPIDNPADKLPKLSETVLESSTAEKIDAKHYTHAEREFKNRSESEKIVIERLMQEVKLMENNEATKNEAAQKAKKLQSLHEEEKIKQLLKIVKDKGVLKAIHVAQKMDDPYILDLLHDVLASEGYYKELIK